MSRERDVAPLYERSLMVRWIIHGVELFLVPAKCFTTGVTNPWYVQSCLWDGAYKRTLAVNRKE